MFLQFNSVVSFNIFYRLNLHSGSYTQSVSYRSGGRGGEGSTSHCYQYK
jgi:hypothetical protein